MVSPAFGVLCVVLLANVHLSLQKCHYTTVAFYRQVADDLWAMQTLRDSLIEALQDTNRQHHSADSYFSLTAIQDALRSRTLDLYPILEHLPHLRTLTPQQQAIFIVGGFTNQRFLGCSAELALKALQDEIITAERNLTTNLDHIYQHRRAFCFSEILDIFWSYLCTCPPSQNLLGGVLINIPVLNNVANYRQIVSNILIENGIDRNDWIQAMNAIDPRNLSLTEWIAELIKNIPDQYVSNEVREDLSSGIIQIVPEPDDEDVSPQEEISTRLHPVELDFSGFFIQPTREEKGIYRIVPATRTRRSSIIQPILKKQKHGKYGKEQKKKEEIP